MATMNEPYVDYVSDETIITITHYFELDGYGGTLPMKGVVAVDLTHNDFLVEMKELDAANEKFYFASSDGQILFLATPDEETQQA